MSGKWEDCSTANYLVAGNSYEPKETKCDNLDNDCDGLVDEGVRFYFDKDTDGFGDPNKSVCKRTSRYVSNKSDCNDGHYGVRPSQKSFIAFPYSGNRYDYNCDGINEKRFTSKATCGGPKCRGTFNRFEKGAIACGSSGNFVTGCYWNRSKKKCYFRFYKRRQPCR